MSNRVITFNRITRSETFILLTSTVYMLLEFFIACNIRYVFLSFDSIKTIIYLLFIVNF